MTRRFVSSRLLLGALALGSMGCETLHSMLRSKNNDAENSRKADEDDPAKPKSVESDTSKIPSVDSDEKNWKPFFQHTGRAGGWSKEANDIEKSLGFY